MPASLGRDPEFRSWPSASIFSGWYPNLLASAIGHVSTGHRRAVVAGNSRLPAAYWAIKRAIPDRQDQEGCGTKVIDRLSVGLKQRFPDARGYSPRNSMYRRAFAPAWPNPKVVRRTVAQLHWRHHIALPDKLGGPELGRWYAATAKRNEWSRDIVSLRIERRLHERAGKAITDFRAVLLESNSDLAKQATCDPYLFNHLDATETHAEWDVERGLIEHVHDFFLLELGQGFAFAFLGRRAWPELGGEEFFCERLFFHIRLRCHVVIELKAVTFNPRYLGLYTAAVDDGLAPPDDRTTIGLLLCRMKNDVVAEYALHGYSTPIGEAEWTSDVITALPEEIASSLPSIAEIEAELAPQPNDAAEER